MASNHDASWRSSDSTKGGNTLKLLDATWWISYCCCAGLGCTKCTDPHLIQGEQKFLCCKSNCTCDLIEVCGNEGCILLSQKICCIYVKGAFPPKAIFCEVLGCKICGAKKGERGIVDAPNEFDAEHAALARQKSSTGSIGSTGRKKSYDSSEGKRAVVTAQNFGSSECEGIVNQFELHERSTDSLVKSRADAVNGIKEALDRSEYHTIYSLVKYLRQIDSAKSQALPDPIKM